MKHLISDLLGVLIRGSSGSGETAVHLARVSRVVLLIVSIFRSPLIARLKWSDSDRGDYLGTLSDARWATLDDQFGDYRVRFSESVILISTAITADAVCVSSALRQAPKAS